MKACMAWNSQYGVEEPCGPRMPQPLRACTATTVVMLCWAQACWGYWGEQYGRFGGDFSGEGRAIGGRESQREQRRGVATGGRARSHGHLEFRGVLQALRVNRGHAGHLQRRWGWAGRLINRSVLEFGADQTGVIQMAHAVDLFGADGLLLAASQSGDDRLSIGEGLQGRVALAIEFEI